MKWRRSVPVLHFVYEDDIILAITGVRVFRMKSEFVVFGAMHILWDRTDFSNECKGTMIEERCSVNLTVKWRNAQLGRLWFIQSLGRSIHHSLHIF